MKRTNKNIKQNIFMISLIIIEVTQKIRIMETIMNRIFQKFLQSVIDLSSVGAKCREDNTHDIDMNPDAEVPIPEWKVYFDGNFWEPSGKGHAGTELRLNKQFEWAGHHWIIPAVYSCNKGLVLDFCMCTPAEDIREFMKKWDLSPENDSCLNFTQEQQLQIDLDNPLCLDIIPCLKLNGKTMQASHSCSAVFNPCLSDETNNELEAKWAVKHYELDISYGWMIFRAAFLWSGKRRPAIKSLSLTMEQQPFRVPGPHFKIHAPGDQFTFSHPVSETEYALTVQKLEQQTLSQNHVGSDRWLYPTHFISMSYTLSPKPDNDISIHDCADSDKPLEVVPATDSFTPEMQNDIACIDIIGGADEPTVILYSDSNQANLHVACSALHFKPVSDDTEWRIEFNIIRSSKKTFLLI